MCGKTMQGTDLGFFHLLKGLAGAFADLLCREMVSGPEGVDQVIGLLGQTKQLNAKPLLHFSGGFIGEGEGHDLRDGQGVRLSQEKVQDTIDEDRGFAGPGSRDHHDVAVPGGLCQVADPENPRAWTDHSSLTFCFLMRRKTRA